MKTLYWLLNFRITILILNFIRKLIYNYKQLLIKSQNNILKNKNNNNNKYIIFNESLHLKCPLCMDFMKNLSCAPCGHLYCWKCIIDYCNNNIKTLNNNNNNNFWLLNLQNNNNNNQLKCPVCRKLFNVQNIRAVYKFDS